MDTVFLKWTATSPAGEYLQRIRGTGRRSDQMKERRVIAPYFGGLFDEHLTGDEIHTTLRNRGGRRP
jgi:hypothetical protein